MYAETSSLLGRLIASNENFLAAKPGLRVYETSEAVLLIGSPESLHKVCHIMLRDGGIFVQAPYLPNSEAVAGVLRWTQPPAGQVTLSFDDGYARTTTKRIKLDHPRDGRAHLSGSGVRTEFWTDAFPLEMGDGQVFDLLISGLAAHRVIHPDNELRKSRVHLPFVFPAGMPAAVSVIGDWISTDRLRSPVVGLPEGPRGTMRDDAGSEFPCFYLAPPSSAGIKDRVLRIMTGPATPFGDGAETVILRGGWSPHGIVRPGAERRCLAFMSPLADLTALTAKLGSAHYNGGDEASSPRGGDGPHDRST